MKLIVVTDEDVKEFLIGEGHENQTWYWRGNLIDSIGTGDLIIKQWCHSGCRIEIPRERVKEIKVYTNEHMEDPDIPIWEKENRSPTAAELLALGKRKQGK